VKVDRRQATKVHRLKVGKKAQKRKENRHASAILLALFLLFSL
jgi:hypothetical protein